MLKGSYLGLFSEWGLSHMPVWKPEAKWRREKQEDGIIEKDSQKWKNEGNQLETERLTDWNANRRRKRGRLTKRIQDTCHLFENWNVYPVAFSLYCVLLTSLMNSRGLVWSIGVISLLFHETFLLVLSIQIL